MNEPLVFSWKKGLCSLYFILSNEIFFIVLVNYNNPAK